MAKSMFNRYGGFAFLSKVVMAFYDQVLDSDTLGPYFDDVSMRRLIDHQTKFIASVMDGPASFTDEHLRAVHAHLGITEPAFDEALGLMRATLTEFRMDAADVERVIGTMRSKADLIIAA